jgi:CHAT domain-containing protein
MKTSNRLVIVPDRGLAILPLHACWWKENDETKYLLDEYVCTYAPSLYILNGSVSHKRELDPQDKLFGLANPNHDDAELRLAFSEWECQEIERLFGNNHCSIRLREQATKGSLLAQAPDFQLLHFSCHAKYELGAPLQSALLLADAMMNTGEIMSQLDLRHTWLTVLSACETSLGDFRDRTNEQYGLPLGFLVAGTPTVWGTLWSVNDLSTALLIKRAYQNLKDGMSKPEALHSAQIALRDMTASNVCEALEETRIGLGSASKVRFGLEDQNQVNMWKESIKHNEKPFAHPYHWAGMQCIGV